MRFCPKCKSIMRPKIKSRILVCRKCGFEYELENEDEYKITRTVRGEEKKIEDIPVIEERIDILPKTIAECPSCGNKEAYWWMLQTRKADEPETKFYRCTKCGYTWREYG